jgi:hypothetical protein
MTPLYSLQPEPDDAVIRRYSHGEGAHETEISTADHALPS